MSSLQSWEQLATAVCVVGGFGVVIGQILNKARNNERLERERDRVDRKKEVDDAIAAALKAAALDQKLADQADEIKRLRERPDG